MYYSGITKVKKLDIFRNYIKNIIKSNNEKLKNLFFNDFTYFKLLIIYYFFIQSL